MDGVSELMACLQIVASPFLIGSGLGFFIYIYKPTKGHLILGILSSLVGLCLGIIWAYRASQKAGAASFMARVSGSPELDQREKDTV